MHLLKFTGEKTIQVEMKILKRLGKPGLFVFELN